MAEAAAVEPVVTPTPAPTPTPVAVTPAPAAVPAPEPKTTTTVLDSDPTADPNKLAPVADWADDWRQKLAGNDEKSLKRLERFASPKALFDSYRALEQRISSGELKAPKLPEGATDEQKAEWRKENGIPEKADDYIADLPDGLVIGEEEKALVADFLKDMHGSDMPKSFVQKALAWNQKMKEAEQDRVYEANTQAKQSTEDALRSEYGNEYRPVVNQIKALLGSAPEGVSDLLQTASDANGVALLNNPNVVRWLAGLAKELNPVATLTGGNNNPSAINDRVIELKKMMGDSTSEYWKGPKAADLQAEYRQLLDAQERHKAKS